MKLSLIFAILTTAASHAQESRTAEDLRRRVELQVQSFLTNADGTQIIYMNAQEGRYRNQAKTGDLTGTWSYNPHGGLQPVKLTFTLKINSDRSLSLSVLPQGTAKGKESLFTMTDFNSVSYVSEAGSKGRVVTRFTPVYSLKSDPETLTYTPIAVRNFIISDNAGRVWDQGGSASGPVMRFETWQGALYISFIPFKGSTELGTAEGRTIELKLSDKLTARILSEEFVVGPEVIGKVYGWYSAGRRTSSRLASSFGTLSATNAEKELNAR